MQKYPDSAAAKFARSQLEALGPAAVAVAADKRTDHGKQASSEHAKKAVSLLKMAKVFAKAKPEKAKQYAEQVIDLAPDSPQAKDARSLIESLDLEPARSP